MKKSILAGSSRALVFLCSALIVVSGHSAASRADDDGNTKLIVVGGAGVAAGGAVVNAIDVRQTKNLTDFMEGNAKLIQGDLRSTLRYAREAVKTLQEKGSTEAGPAARALERMEQDAKILPGRAASTLEDAAGVARSKLSVTAIDGMFQAHQSLQDLTKADQRIGQASIQIEKSVQADQALDRLRAAKVTFVEYQGFAKNYLAAAQGDFANATTKQLVPMMRKLNPGFEDLLAVYGKMRELVNGVGPNASALTHSQASQWLGLKTQALDLMKPSGWQFKQVSQSNGLEEGSALAKEMRVTLQGVREQIGSHLQVASNGLDSVRSSSAAKVLEGGLEALDTAARRAVAAAARGAEQLAARTSGWASEAMQAGVANVAKELPVAEEAGGELVEGLQAGAAVVEHIF